MSKASFMKVKSSLAIIITVGAISTTTNVLAKTVSLAQGQKIINSCNGASWSAGGTTATSGCMNKDGHGVVCGGKDPKYQNNCSTFRVVGSDTRPIAGRLGTVSSSR
jgi:hypothetical protein